MTLQQLKLLLVQRLGDSHAAASRLTPLSVISRACGTDDVAVLLRNVELLVQHFSNGAYATETARLYLQNAKRLLQLKQVQQLLGAEQVQQVEEQLDAALSNGAAAGELAAAAAEAAGGIDPLQGDAAAAGSDAHLGLAAKAGPAAAGGAGVRAVAARGSSAAAAATGMMLADGGAAAGTASKAPALAGASGATGAAKRSVRGEVRAAVLDVIEQLEFQDSPAYYDRYDYLSADLLQAAADSSASLVQLQALQQVMDWLLQLPAGLPRDAAIDVLRQSDGWLQQLLQCWAEEVAETGCSVQQAAAAGAQRYAAAFGDGVKVERDVSTDAGPSTLPATAAAAAHGGSRRIDGYLAGLCQLLLQLLRTCCHQVLPGAAAGSTATAHADVQQQLDINSNSSSRAALLQQLAGALLAGNAALLLKQWPADSLQERCTLAGLWRSCLWVNLQRCRDGKAGAGSEVRQVQQLCKHLQASLPQGQQH
jgi:hypothetical protein